MHFHYDAQGKPSMMMYNGTRFGYLYNTQGDVIGIITGGLSEKVKYTYDAWGRLLSITGSSANTIGKANPFRYRAYIYDQECGLYYLRTRYYNPNWCRFINGDILIIDNLFAYCVNNPIGLSDYTGNYADDAGTGSGISWISTAVILAGAPLTLAQMMQMLVTSLTNSVSVPKSNYDSSNVTLSNSIVEAVSGATPIQPENYKNYSLYVLTKGNNSTVLYIGITNNPKRREGQHRRNPKRGTDYYLTVVATGFTKEQARTAEAVAINAYTLKILENMRREIAPSKVKQYGDLLKSVWNFEDLTTDFLMLDTRW